MSEEPLPPSTTIDFARQLLNQGRPFSAHEVFEARWKASPEAERDLWQGLAQLCVGITHAERGNQVGALRLATRARLHLETYAATDGPRYGLNLSRLIHWIQVRENARGFQLVGRTPSVPQPVTAQSKLPASNEPPLRGADRDARKIGRRVRLRVVASVVDTGFRIWVFVAVVASPLWSDEHLIRRGLRSPRCRSLPRLVMEAPTPGAPMPRNLTQAARCVTFVVTLCEACLQGQASLPAGQTAALVLHGHPAPPQQIPQALRWYAFHA